MTCPEAVKLIGAFDLTEPKQGSSGAPLAEPMLAVSESVGMLAVWRNATVAVPLVHAVARTRTPLRPAALMVETENDATLFVVGDPDRTVWPFAQVAELEAESIAVMLTVAGEISGVIWTVDVIDCDCAKAATGEISAVKTRRTRLIDKRPPR